MKMLMKEYGGIIIAVAAALPLCAAVLKMFRSQGIFFDVLQGFAEAIC